MPHVHGRGFVAFIDENFVDDDDCVDDDIIVDDDVVDNVSTDIAHGLNLPSWAFMPR